MFFSEMDPPVQIVLRRWTRRGTDWSQPALMPDHAASGTWARGDKVRFARVHPAHRSHANSDSLGVYC